MKKFNLSILMAIFIALNVLALTCFVGAEVVTDAPSEEVVEEVVEEAPTLTSRLAEAWENGNVQDAAVILWGLANTAFMLIVKKASKTDSDKIIDNAKKSAREAAEKTNELINALNGVMTTLETLGVNLDKVLPTLEQKMEGAQIAEAQSIQSLEEKVGKYSEAMIAFADMMRTVYAGSKTIPQSTKDIVNADYMKVIDAIAEKAADDEEAQ